LSNATQNWPPLLKLFILCQVSWLAGLGPMGAAIINPAFVPLSKEFDITVVQASYQVTVFIISGGIAPLLMVPLANVWYVKKLSSPRSYSLLSVSSSLLRNVGVVVTFDRDRERDCKVKEYENLLCNE
jgi:hypothetical protein